MRTSRHYRKYTQRNRKICIKKIRIRKESLTQGKVEHKYAGHSILHGFKIKLPSKKGTAITYTILSVYLRGSIPVP